MINFLLNKILFFVLFFSFLQASISPFKGMWKQYKYIDGISSNYIFDIEKDEFGKVWIGTSNGVTVFNGSQITKYGLQSGLPSTNITHIIYFKKNIYVGTSNKGVFRLVDNTFRKMSDISGSKVSHMEIIEGSLFFSTDLENSFYDGEIKKFAGSGFPNSSINDHLKFNSDSYFFTKDGIIKKESENSYRFEKLSFSSKGNSINCVKSYKKSIYIGTNNGLWKLDKNNNIKFIKGISGINCLLNLKDDLLIIGSKDGLFYFDSKNIKSFDQSKNIQLPKNISIRDIYANKKNEIWYASYGDGLYLQDASTIINIDESDGLITGGMVNSLLHFEDISYLGTNNGLFLLKGNKIFRHYNLRDGLKSKKILDMDIDLNGTLWLATTKGLSRLKSGKIINFTKSDGLPSNLVLSVHIDKNNSNIIWTGSMKSGLTRYNEEGFFTFSAEDGLPSNWVQDIVQEASGNLILACYNQGVVSFDGENFKLYNKELIDKRVISISIGSDETIWVATESAGIGKLKDNVFEMMDVSRGLGHNETYSIYAHNDKILVGTFGGGLSTLVNDSWLTINSFDGLINNKIGSIISSGSKKYIIGAEDGISIIEIDDDLFPLDAKNIITPKSDISLDNALKNGINGVIEDRFYIQANPLLYKPTSSEFKFRTRLQLKGENNADWTELKSISNIEFSPNKVGLYELQVQAVENRFKFSKILKIPFNISYAWYLNPKTAIPFWGGLLALISFSIFIFINFLKKSKETKMLIEKERKRQQFELDEAREFQQALLPSKMPKTDIFEMIGFQKTATEVGGDYFDFTQKENGDWVAICGDATGHGLTSGNVVSITKTAMGALTESDPVSTLDSLNKTLLKMNIGLNRMCLNIANIEKDRIHFSSAGMPPAYYYSSQHGTLEEVLVGALPLGSFKMAKHNSKEITFKDKGDVFVMMSDGLPEAENSSDEMVGYDRTLDTIKSLIDKPVEDIKDGLISMCERWLDGEDLKDDMTFVIIKRVA